MSDQPIDHSARAAALRGDLNPHYSGQTDSKYDPSGLAARAALATAHELAALGDLITEMKFLLEALAGPAAIEAAEAAAINAPDHVNCRVCGGVARHILVEIENASTGVRELIPCPRGPNATGSLIPLLRTTARPDSKDRIS